MKNYTVLDALDNISPEFIAEASEYSAEKSKSNMLKWIATAASVCIIAAGTFAALQGSFNSVGSQEMSNGDVNIAPPQSSLGEVVEIPKWEDRFITAKFPYLNFRGNNYSVILYKSKEDALDFDITTAKLGSTVLSNTDLFTGTAHFINADIYSVKNFDTNCIVAVNFEGTDEYYIYTNSYYSPETLGDFINALDLKNSLFFGKAFYSYFESDEFSDSYTQMQFESIDSDIIWSMLLEDPSIPNSYNQDGWYPNIFSINASIPSINYSASMWLTEDGYLFFNLLESGKAFFIGEEKVQNFIQYVIDNYTPENQNTDKTEKPTQDSSQKTEDFIGIDSSRPPEA